MTGKHQHPQPSLRPIGGQLAGVVGHGELVFQHFQRAQHIHPAAGKSHGRPFARRGKRHFVGQSVPLPRQFVDDGLAGFVNGRGARRKIRQQPFQRPFFNPNRVNIIVLNFVGCQRAGFIGTQHRHIAQRFNSV